MTVYLDMCCLKRPFDDQTQPRISVETTAILSILRAVAEVRLHAVRSVAHDLENEVNPDARRAAAVAAWLCRLNPIKPTPAQVRELVARLLPSALKPLDAYHLAWADYLDADVLVTYDDRFLAGAKKVVDLVRVRVVDPVSFVEEIAS